MRILVNYATPSLRPLQRVATRTALAFGGFERVVERSPADLDAGFRRRNAALLAERRGGGYWVWKPYIVREALAAARPGDFLMYCDVDQVFLRSVAPLEAEMRRTGESIAAYRLEHQLERMWTKRDCFVAMGCDEARYADTRQLLAGFSAWRRTGFALDFLDAWLHWAQQAHMVTDAPSRGPLPDYPGFREHRHDQSVFSLLCKQRGVAGRPQGPLLTQTSWGALARASWRRPHDVGLHAAVLWAVAKSRRKILWRRRRPGRAAADPRATPGARREGDARAARDGPSIDLAGRGHG